MPKRWTVGSLIKALSESGVPLDAEVSFDGCGCCTGDEGISSYKGGHPKWSKTYIAPWVSIGYVEKLGDDPV